MSTITVSYLLNDTTVEETFTAERITYQHFDSGRLQVRLWAGGRVTQYVNYRQAERVHRIDGDLVPREDRP
jgi:YD repeat-containing protein